ncbi:MAG: sigma-70 family RNA polymerase sigma factor [Peptococcaceae bacterium]
MDSYTAKQKSIDKLQKLSAAKGYITYDDILEVTDSFALSMVNMTKVSEYLLTCGCIIRENDKHYIDEDDDEEISIIDRSKLDYEEIFQNVLLIDPGLESYVDAIRMIPPPQYREADNLIIPAQQGNAYAKERLILMYLKVVIKIAIWGSNKYRLPLADAIQLGNIGLIKAVDKYEPSTHNKFSTYAPWWIRQNISREAQTLNSLLYFPVHIKEKLFELYDIISEHYCKKCNENDFCEGLIARIMEKSEVDYTTAHKYLKYIYPCYCIDDFLEKNKDEVFSDFGLMEYEMMEIIDKRKIKEDIAELLSYLKPREKKVLFERYGFINGRQKTLEQVGQVMGVTRERVRQIEAKVLKRLQHQLKRDYNRFY